MHLNLKKTLFGRYYLLHLHIIVSQLLNKNLYSQFMNLYESHLFFFHLTNDHHKFMVWLHMDSVKNFEEKKNIVKKTQN
jgi:hypothetical protein